MELNGTYRVVFKNPQDKSRDRLFSFLGKCENFNPSGKCAFLNDKNNTMLVVEYEDIVQMRSIQEGVEKNESD